MAVLFKRKDGKTVTLLNPGEKGKKFAQELRDNRKYTNDGKLKSDAPLSKEEKAWRSGYLSARKDSAAAHNAKNKKSQVESISQNQRDDIFASVFGLKK